MPARWLAVLLLLVAAALHAHPIPDIPVRTFFANGNARVTVEIDPRGFEPDPESVRSLLPADLSTLDESQKNGLTRRAADFVSRNVEFIFEPIGKVQPEFRFTFTGKAGVPVGGPEDPVVMTGEWKVPIIDGLTGWRIRSLPGAKLSVVFQNVINDRSHERIAVLFPGETSFTLDLTTLRGGSPAATAGAIRATGSDGDRLSTFWQYLRQGFIHVVPEGLDHILFVLGLFLLSREWKPLLLQVTTFTLAHSVTLTLATLGIVKLSGRIVEPVIAASIAFVALENIFRPRYTHWRLIVVLAFGLIHGLGFADALQEFGLSTTSLATSLAGFNIGVEGGQLAVIAVAFTATFRIREPARYRRWIVIPGSLCIAAAGVWWTFERIFGE